MNRIEPIRGGSDGVSGTDVPSVKRVGREQAAERRQREKAARDRLNEPEDRPEQRRRRRRGPETDGDGKPVGNGEGEPVGDGDGEPFEDGDERPSIDIRA